MQSKHLFAVAFLTTVAACGTKATTTSAPSSQSATPAPSASTAETSSTALPEDSGAPDLGDTAQPSEKTPQAESITYPSGSLSLKALLYRPKGNGPFPSIVWNHGSERDPGRGVALAELYTSHGYVLMLPRRRGHGGSPGEYLGDAVAKLPKADRVKKTIEGLEAENQDVVAAFDYLRAQSYVDKTRLIVTGCSYGGIQTLLTAEHTVPGLRAAVDFAGGAESWSHAEIRNRLSEAAKKATVPMFLIQAENDWSTGPTKDLSAAMDEAKKPHEMKIFPPYGTSHGDGHGKFCTKATDVWGPTILAFLQSNAK